MVKKILHRFEIDRAIIFLLLGRGISLLAQPITLFLIGKSLSSIEQGYYYTFSNIISLSVFIELGLGTILTQFASYEFAFLEWSNGFLKGKEFHLYRFFSLFKKTLKWYCLMSLIFLIVIIPIGLKFFDKGDSSVNYVFPWILLVIINSITLVTYSISSLLEGCGQVASIQLMKLIQSLIGSLTIWIVLYNKGGLYSASALASANLVISLSWLYFRYRKVISQAIKADWKPGISLSWRNEILPLQWRIGLSWVSGYIIFQAINPILFEYRGAIEAGKMGMTLSLSSLAMVIGIAWVSAKVPTYGSLISKNEINKLKAIAKKNTIIAFIVTLICSSLIIFLLIGLFKYFPQYENRILSIWALAALLLNNSINVIITSMSAYLRAFKVEPFLISSIIGALLTGILIFVCAKYYNAEILSFCILLLNIFIGLPMVVYVYNIYDKKITKRSIS